MGVKTPLIASSSNDLPSNLSWSFVGIDEDKFFNVDWLVDADENHDFSLVDADNNHDFHWSIETKIAIFIGRCGQNRDFHWSMRTKNPNFDWLTATNLAFEWLLMQPLIG